MNEHKTTLVDIENAIHKMVVEHPQLSVEQICKKAWGTNPDTGKLNKSHFTLFKELNPNDPTAKLGYQTLIQLMHTCRDLAPLEAVAEFFDCRLMPSGECEPTAPTMMEEMHEDDEKLVKFHANSIRFRKGTASKAELKASKRAVIEDVRETYTRTIRGDFMSGDKNTQEAE